MTARAASLASGDEPGSAELIRELMEHDPGAVRAALLRAYLEAGGVTARAAKALGMPPRTLRRWVDRMGLRELIAERWPKGSGDGDEER